MSIIYVLYVSMQNVFFLKFHSPLNHPIQVSIPFDSQLPYQYFQFSIPLWYGTEKSMKLLQPWTLESYPLSPLRIEMVLILGDELKYYNGTWNCSKLWENSINISGLKKTYIRGCNSPILSNIAEKMERFCPSV